MAKKRKRTHSKTTFPMAVVAGFSVPVVRTYNAGRSGGLQAAATELSTGMTGYDPWAGNFDLLRLRNGLLPVIVGTIGHRVASMLGINRALGAAKIPFIRI